MAEQGIFTEHVMCARKIVLSSCIAAAFLLLPIIGLAGDSIHLEEPNNYNNPKDTFGTPPSEWNKADTQVYGIPPSQWYSTWQDNPALVDLQSNYVFIASMFYMGSYNEFETDLYQAFSGGVGGSYAETSEEYAGNNAGTDLGFMMKFNDSSTFGAILHYRYDGILGYGDTSQNFYNGAGVSLTLNTESVRRSDANSTGLTLLYDVDYSDAFSLGLSLAYMYTNDNTNYDEYSVGMNNTGAVVDEDIRIARETIFNIHRLSPTIGTSFSPSDRFILNVSFTTDFLFGGVEKNAIMTDYNTTYAISSTYREHLDDGKLSGYGFSGEADTEIFLTDALSLTYLANASYRDTSWEIDGATGGYFLPLVYYGLAYGPGSADYESEERTWHATAGAGMNYDLSGVALHSLITYTRWERSTAFYQENPITAVGPPVPTSNFTQRTDEELDIMNLKLGATFDISSLISMDLGIGYSVGWANYNLYEATYSPVSPTEFITTAKDTDTFHDMTVGSSMIISPLENFNITLSAMGKFPLNQRKYNLSGTTNGATLGAFPISSWGGSTIRDYGSSTWNYGGTLSIGYEF